MYLSSVCPCLLFVVSTVCTYEERLAELGLPSLELRRRHFDLAQVYKIVNRKDNVEWATLFDLTGSDLARVTRASQDPNNIRQQAPKTELRKQFFSNRVVVDWNKLPKDVKTSKNVKVFKKELENHIK